MNAYSISFVIPVKDEEGSLRELFDALPRESGGNRKIEVIFVDDGSTDGSWQCIEQLKAAHGQVVRAVRLRRNVGKADALGVGFEEANGDVIFTLDADLQDDPKEIVRFLAKLDEGYDIVTGWKRQRHDPWHKVWPSRVFNSMLSRLLGVELHDHNCGYKCYRAAVAKELALYGGMHRMIPCLARLRGYRTAEIEVEHHPRRFGVSKYGLRRFYKGFLDMWTVFAIERFQHNPFQMTTALAMLAAGTGIVFMLVGLLNGAGVANGVLEMAGAGFLGAVFPLLGIGLVAELSLFARMAKETGAPVAGRLPRPEEAVKIVPLTTALRTNEEACERAAIASTNGAEAGLRMEECVAGGRPEEEIQPLRALP
jgi:glycosyltransferase involved in cell wall biosynthesis